jgi:hypothetical protein
MKIVHERDAASLGASAHRPGGIGFSSLLKGQEGSVGNFHLMLVHALDYRAPRHRHNFDQVRIILAGAFGFDDGQVQQAGSVGYFTEGSYYTQTSQGASTTLLLQSAGASGHGYMSDQQLRDAVAQLQAKGSFENGIFTWLDDAGKKHNQDGYEAAWEHVHGRAISYAKPRYDRPVILQPELFAWQKTSQEGVEERQLGQFTEGKLTVSQLRLASGCAAQVNAGQQETLLFLLQGNAHIGTVALQAGSAVQLSTGETLELAAQQDGCVFYVLKLIARPE